MPGLVGSEGRRRDGPQAGEYGNETWENGSWKVTGATNVWSLMSADRELGYVYLPVGTPGNDWYGGPRLGANLFGTSIVCLDAATGERVWHFQTTHHELWDYDLASAPNLVAITVDCLSLIPISEPTRLCMISYAVSCLKKKKIALHVHL